MGKKAGNKKMLPHFQAADTGNLQALVDCLKESPKLRDSVNGDGWTLLHQAAYSGQEAVIKGLIKAGASVKARCHDGCTALHYASAQGHIAVIRILAEAGADLDVMDNDGESPLDVADGPRTRTAIRKLVELMGARIADEQQPGGGKKGRGNASDDSDGGDDDEDAGDWEEADEDEATEALKVMQLTGSTPKPIEVGLKGGFAAALHEEQRREVKAAAATPPQRRAYVPDDVPTRAVKKL